jgi:hypothetical protein
VLVVRLAVVRFVVVRFVLDRDFGRADEADRFAVVRLVPVFVALVFRCCPRMPRGRADAALFWRDEACLAGPAARETARLRDDFLVAIRCSEADQ